MEPSQIADRLRRLQAQLGADDIDAAVIVQNTDLAYFTGTNQQAHLIVPAAGEPRLLVRRTVERAREESPLAAIDPLRSLAGLGPALADAGLEPGARIGFELDVIPARAYLGYRRRLESFELVDASASIARVRAVKSAEDIEAMRRAAAQVDAAVRAAAQIVRPGIPESQAALELEAVLRAEGHQGLMRYRGFNQEMFYGQVLAGPSGAVAGYSDSPLCGPGPNPTLGKGSGSHVLAAGDPVIIDLVGALDGWLADQTRTIFLRPAPDDLLAAHAHAVEILRVMETELRPGAVPSQLFELAEQMAQQAGPGRTLHGLGPRPRAVPGPRRGHGGGRDAGARAGVRRAAGGG